MLPILPLIALGAAAAWLYTHKQGSMPVAPAPSGGGVVPVAKINTAAGYTILTVDEFTTAVGDKGSSEAPTSQGLIDDAPPPHGLVAGQTVFLILTEDGLKWFPVMAKVVTPDASGARGFVTLITSELAPGGPPIGTPFNISTGTNEDAAYIDTATPSAADWLANHRFGGVSV